MKRLVKPTGTCRLVFKKHTQTTRPQQTQHGRFPAFTDHLAQASLRQLEAIVLATHVKKNATMAQHCTDS